MSIWIPVAALAAVGLAALVLVGWSLAAAAKNGDDIAGRP